VLDWRSELPGIANKALVIGAESSIFSAQSQRWNAAQMQNARAEIFAANEGGSHFMFYENPEKFNALVNQFLA
jgi:non-heme chloroperoxidase